MYERLRRSAEKPVQTLSQGRSSTHFFLLSFYTFAHAHARTYCTVLVSLLCPRHATCFMGSGSGGTAVISGTTCMFLPSTPSISKHAVSGSQNLVFRHSLANRICLSPFPGSIERAVFLLPVCSSLLQIFFFLSLPSSCLGCFSTLVLPHERFMISLSL